MPIRVKSIIHQCFRHSFDQRSINTHSSCSLQRSLLSHVLQRVAFFCALLTCAYYKIYCSNSFKKKRFTNTAERKEWERLKCCICCFPKQNNFSLSEQLFFLPPELHRTLNFVQGHLSGMTLAATGAQTLCTTVAEEQPLSAHPDTFMFQTHIQGQGN